MTRKTGALLLSDVILLLLSSQTWLDPTISLVGDSKGILISIQSQGKPFLFCFLNS